ncbi:hypothetical protein AX16_004150 [Volvariella volvacea WC 439]|nr:hypothetical protein AX16_004150 [Volvariella volvacea WC 439]
MAHLDNSDLESSSSSQPKLQLRFFRRSDEAAVKQLFLHGMIYGPNSPCNAALKHTLTEPKAYIFYILIGAGTLLSIFSPPGPSSSFVTYRIGGAALALGSSALFLLYRHMVFRGFLGYCNASLGDDMRDIVERYGLREVRDAKGGAREGDFVPAGPAGFWVVEKLGEAGGVNEIVGSVGLDVPEGPGSEEGELRRMMVSSSVRRSGIGGMLLTALESHARQNGVKSIHLTTTIFQPAARRLYEKFGWEVASARFDGNVFFRVPLYKYRKVLN